MLARNCYLACCKYSGLNWRLIVGYFYGNAENVILSELNLEICGGISIAFMYVF